MKFWKRVEDDYPDLGILEPNPEPITRRSILKGIKFWLIVIGISLWFAFALPAIMEELG